MYQIVYDSGFLLKSKLTEMYHYGRDREVTLVRALAGKGGTVKLSRSRLLVSSSAGCGCRQNIFHYPDCRAASGAGPGKRNATPVRMKTQVLHLLHRQAQILRPTSLLVSANPLSARKTIWTPSGRSLAAASRSSLYT